MTSCKNIFETCWAAKILLHALSCYIVGLCFNKLQELFLIERKVSKKYGNPHLFRIKPETPRLSRAHVPSRLPCKRISSMPLYSVIFKRPTQIRFRSNRCVWSQVEMELVSWGKLDFFPSLSLFCAPTTHALARAFFFYGVIQTQPGNFMSSR